MNRTEQRFLYLSISFSWGDIWPEQLMTPSKEYVYVSGQEASSIMLPDACTINPLHPRLALLEELELIPNLTKAWSYHVPSVDATPEISNATRKLCRGWTPVSEFNALPWGGNSVSTGKIARWLRGIPSWRRSAGRIRNNRRENPRRKTSILAVRPADDAEAMLTRLHASVQKYQGSFSYLCREGGSKLCDLRKCGQTWHLS